MLHVVIIDRAGVLCQMHVATFSPTASGAKCKQKHLLQRFLVQNARRNLSCNGFWHKMHAETFPPTVSGARRLQKPFLQRWCKMHAETLHVVIILGTNGGGNSRIFFETYSALPPQIIQHPQQKTLFERGKRSHFFPICIQHCLARYQKNNIFL